MTEHVKITEGRGFDFGTESVAEGFNAHVREQLPWYDLVTSAVVQIARHYVTEEGLVYDIGASNGNVGRALEPLLAERGASLIGVEPSPTMAERYDAPGRLHIGRAEEEAYEPFDFAVAMLCLMFVQPSEVPGLLRKLTDAMRPHGALVVVERMMPPPGYLSIVSSRLTLAAKRQAGATGDEIVTKELSLAGVQRPLSRGLLRAYGAVEWFRYGDFAGWLIQSPKRHEEW